MKERVYQGIILVLLVLFLVFFIKTNDDYMDLLEVSDEQTALIDKQRSDNEKIVNSWQESYEELQIDYGKLLKENDELKEVEIVDYYFTEAEVYLIAQCVEAKAGDYKGHELSQQYVCQVILNRLHSGKFPSSVEEVIYEKNNGCPQFSVAYNGMMDDRVVEPETLANVYKVIVHGTDLPEYVCYFYSDSVTENWVNKLPVYDTVDGTVFAYESKEDY